MAPRRNKRPLADEPQTKSSQSQGPPSKQRPFSTQPQRPAQAPKNETPSAQVSRVQTPPLSTPVPQDTPRFVDLEEGNLLHPTILKTIVEDLKFDHMMPVQAATLPLLLEKRDCLAQAKTGTGKTIAFLLPAIQTMIAKGARNKSRVSLLVLSPTRELALQIAKEAEKLLQRLPEYQVKTAIGGTKREAELRNLKTGCDILVATPGRLLDYLSEEVDYGDNLSQLRTLVLDEADRMLDMGFLPDIKKVLQHLPNKQQVPRQSMLFSATIEGQIQKVAHEVLNHGYEFISTVPAGENNTHEHVSQFLVLAPSLSEIAPAMVAALKQEALTTTSFKAIVFAPTAAQADCYGHIFSGVKEIPPVSILHSRLSQNTRTKTTQKFRDATNAICVATDVIARGMDFPNVTHVFQVGIPSDKASYIHRLGRTARAGSNGRGILILAEVERNFLYQLKGINIQPYKELKYNISDIQFQLNNLENKRKVYQAWLGYYKTFMKTMGWTAPELVRQANIFAMQGLQCEDVPELEKKTIGKMGLKGVAGLRVAPNAPNSGGPGQKGGGEGRQVGNGRHQGPK